MPTSPAAALFTPRALQDQLNQYLEVLDTLVNLTSPDAPQGDLARTPPATASLVCEIGERLAAHQRQLERTQFREIVGKLTAA